MTNSRPLRTCFVLLSTFAASSLLSGCLLVGYSNRGGFFVWPGSVGLVLLLALLWWLLRSR